MALLVSITRVVSLSHEMAEKAGTIDIVPAFGIY
jgi:hypothetical protein